MVWPQFDSRGNVLVAVDDGAVETHFIGGVEDAFKVESDDVFLVYCQLIGQNEHYLLSSRWKGVSLHSGQRLDAYLVIQRREDACWLGADC